jgi:hypothetical protein
LCHGWESSQFVAETQRFIAGMVEVDWFLVCFVGLRLFGNG